MEDIDGNLVTMTAYFGTIGFGTLEPGNGALEEQISFTGVTQNANGTATLTGVSSVTFSSPYTATSGLLKTHAGSVPFIISNTAGFYDKLTSKLDDETIAGTWTFPTADPTRAGIGADTDTSTATAFVTLGQLSRQAISGASNAATTVKGIVQLSTQAQADAKTTTGSTGALLVNTPDLARSTLLSDYVASDTGSANAYAIAPTPAISAYAAGQAFSFKAAHTNTLASTLAVSGLTAKAIKKLDGATALTAGDITTGQIITVEYDGTNFQMLNPSAINALPAFTSSQINEFITTGDGTTLSFGRPFDYQSFTSSGTWTKPTNLSGNEMVIVQTWGGGGGGGGTSGDAAGGSGGGGGGGTFNEGHFRVSDLGSTVTVTIGAAGAANSGSGGGAGGNTTFGSLLTAFGGGGGGGIGNGGNTSGGAGGGGGILSAGSAGSGATDGAGGNPSGAGFGGGSAGTQSVYGGSGGGHGSFNGTGAAGGDAYFGGAGGGGGSGASGGTGGAGGATKTGFGGAGGAGASSNGNGSVGTAPGGGGGGGGRYNSSTAFAGGAGAKGECRVWTFY